MRYVQIQFEPWDRRSWTYEHDGDDPIEIGDKVEVPTPKGAQIVTVVGLTDEAPAFKCKPITRVLAKPDPFPPDP